MEVAIFESFDASMWSVLFVDRVTQLYQESRYEKEFVKLGARNRRRGNRGPGIGLQKLG